MAQEPQPKQQVQHKSLQNPTEKAPLQNGPDNTGRNGGMIDEPANTERTTLND